MNEPKELQKAVELLPCPFCGGEAKMVEVGNDRTPKRSVIIKCEKCKVKRTDSAIRQDMEWLINVSVEQWNARSYAKHLSALEALSDLHRDEFIRIRTITTDTEIQGLCDRAVTQIEQHVPLIVERDSAVDQYLELRAENEDRTLDIINLTGKCAEFEQERDSLSAALKECAEALKRRLTRFGHEPECLSFKVVKKHRSGDTNDSDEFGECDCCKRSLSNPHVQKILKP